MNDFWLRHLLAAAADGPSSFDFIRRQYLKELDRHDILNFGGGRTKAAIRGALELYDIVTVRKLPFEINFQCIPETIQFEDCLDILYYHCPNWVLSPQGFNPGNSAFYNADGNVDRVLLTNFFAHKMTDGGYPYRALSALVTAETATIFKMYFEDLRIIDYSNLVA